MSRRNARTAAVTVALAVAGLAPGMARADGLPVPVEDAGPTGVTSVDGSVRFVTVPAGRGTVVERVDRATGKILQSRFLPGTFTIPVVALDGSPAGLSHDGGTLVLIRPRVAFPRARTTLAILDSKSLRPRRVLTLRGDFSFDALSAQGGTAYLVQYVSPNDPTRYLVRALDAARGRLLPHPVIDPRERGDDMRGYPVTRATSPDGRWEYTLYDGAGKGPFVHALDTQARRARCIDLPSSLAETDVYRIRLTLGPGGRGLTVGRPRQALATIDTASFRVSTPPPAGPSGAGEGASLPPGGAVAVTGAALLVLSAGLALALRRRRRVIS